MNEEKFTRKEIACIVIIFFWMFLGFFYAAFGFCPVEKYMDQSGIMCYLIDGMMLISLGYIFIRRKKK